ncbi:S-layer homology domain-containing protein, partial [Patescibacteria group bacterium]|nr:S-layer homology domain-containing protein [Patescibacteria group bacterium]
SDSGVTQPSDTGVTQPSDSGVTQPSDSGVTQPSEVAVSSGNIVNEQGLSSGGGGGGVSSTGPNQTSESGAYTSSFTTCAGYKDVSASDQACDAITYAQHINAMTGNPDGTFDPDGLLQRDQVSKIILESFYLYNNKVDYCQGSNPFPDVLEIDWSRQYICRARVIGTVTGYLGGIDKGSFRPARNVNRVEFLAILLRNIKEEMPSIYSRSYSDVPTGQWYSGYARYSYDNGLFTGLNLHPSDYMTRREVAQVLYKMGQLGKL